MRYVTTRLSILICTLVTLGLSPTLLAQPEIQATNDGNGILAQGYSADDIASMSIRIVGPDGFVFQDRVENSVIDWVPAGELADGMYNWETRMVTVESGAPVREDPKLHRQNETATVQDGSDAQAASLESAAPKNAEQEIRKEIPLERFFDDEYKHVEKTSGRFRVRDGFIEPINNRDGELSHTRKPGLIGSIAGAVLDFVFPSAHAQQTIADDLILEDSSPCLRYDDTETTVGDSDWNACAWVGEGFFIREGSSADTGGAVSDAEFAIEEGAPDSSLFIRSNGNVGLGTSTPTEEIHIQDISPRIRIEDTGDNQSWYIKGNDSGLFQIAEGTGDPNPFTIESGAPDSSLYVADNGNVGIGTETPSSSESFPDPTLHISGSSPSLRLGGFEWTHSALSSFFRGSSGQGIVQILADAPAASLRIEDNGNVGMGTSSPDFTVDVESDTGAGQIRITETNGSNGLTMFALENTGHPRFRLRNSRLNSNWDFRTAGSDASNNEQFQITNISNGESNFLFRLFKNGDLEVEGDVTANGVLLTSSRASKTDFAPLDENEVLANLSELQISKWRYKHEKEGTQHFGPIAEDFHEIFGLSDGKHLNMVDVGGIAFAAIQALHEKNTALGQQNEQLMERLDRLEKAIQQ